MYKRSTGDYSFLWNSWQTCFSFPCEILSGCCFLTVSLHSSLLNAPLRPCSLFSVVLTWQLKENVKQQLTPVKCPLCHGSTKSEKWWRGFCTESVGVAWLILTPASDNLHLLNKSHAYMHIYFYMCLYLYNPGASKYRLAV